MAVRRTPANPSDFYAISWHRLLACLQEGLSMTVYRNLDRFRAEA